MGYTSKDNILTSMQDQMQQGKLTADQANVLMVRMEGVRIVRGKVMRDVRKALNAAVKTGELGHLKKDGLKPEVYFNPNSRTRAIEERNRAERSALATLSGVFARP